MHKGLLRGATLDSARLSTAAYARELRLPLNHLSGTADDRNHA